MEHGRPICAEPVRKIVSVRPGVKRQGLAILSWRGPVRVLQGTLVLHPALMPMVHDTNQVAIGSARLYGSAAAVNPSRSSIPRRSPPMQVPAFFVNTVQVRAAVHVDGRRSRATREHQKNDTMLHAELQHTPGPQANNNQPWRLPNLCSCTHSSMPATRSKQRISDRAGPKRNSTYDQSGDQVTADACPGGFEPPTF